MFYLQDLRYACRQLARNLAFTLLTVVVLAGGLAVSIFTFSFLYTAILKPLPVPQGEQVVALGVFVTVALIVLAAAWLPTRRAIAIAPSEALWRE